MTMHDNSWVEIGGLTDIPKQGSRVVRTARGDLAVFRSAEDEVFALWDRCPHRGGPLSQGIVHGRNVTCPLHNWVIDLENGTVQGPDEGCARGVAVKLDGGRILIEGKALAGKAA